MRPEPNKDIDLLLRQLARRDGTPVSEIQEQHLDADELNSYVANALPSAARARYTEHLADCSSCRKLVIQLSAAQGPFAVQQSATVVAPSGLKSFLASLLSPMVLRYAVPALGVIVIAAVGFVVFRPSPRSTERGTEVARLADTDQGRAALETSREAPVASSAAPANKTEAPHREVAAPQTKEAAPAPVVANKPDAAPAVAEPAAEPPPPGAKVMSSETAVQPKPETEKEKKAEAQQTAGDLEAARQRAEDARKDRVLPLHDGVTVPGTGVARRDARRPAKPAQGAGTGDVASAAPTATAGRDYNQARDERRNEAPSAETRSVAGRRFRKSAGVWIDTAYNSSAEITNVARGSEQYRALVADEPAIRTIAEELDGQIVVVWKGRTYRIR